MQDLLLWADKISYGYDDRLIFEGFSLKIFSGDKLVIYGKNGSGKSTMLSLLAGLDEPKSGIIGKKDYLKIAYLFQDSNAQFIAPSVIEDVAFSLLADGVAPALAEQKAREMLEFFGIAHLANRSIYELSGGEKRIVAIAGVLVRDADVYLLDEPFNELDSVKIELVTSYLLQKNLTFVLITHREVAALQGLAYAFEFDVR